MKNNLYYIIYTCIVLVSSNIYAQVGIGNLDPNTNALLEVGDGTDTGGIILPRVELSSTTNFSPLTAHVEGMMVYNTVTSGSGYSAVTPGQYYNNGSNWIRVGANGKPIDSVTLTTDVLLAGSTFVDISGMSLTFIARKTEALVYFSVSGLGYTGSLTFASFRLYDSSTLSIIGGTNSSAQSLWRTGPNTYSITTWSAAFSKKITGLTIGNSYTIVLQGKTDNLLGTDGVAIYPVTYPNTSHASLSIFQ